MAPTPLRCLIAFSWFCMALGGCAATDASALRFQFGKDSLTSSTVYSTGLNCGFEPGAALADLPEGGVSGAAPFYFTARVPHEGNWRVTVTLVNPLKDAPTFATVKAELRRLAIEHAPIPPGGTITRSFVVNTRVPQIAARNGVAAGVVDLKAPRETTMEAWAWDDAITLEFNGDHPAVRSVTIEPADVPTIFLLGDSTVCDQSLEPYNSWGQMLPRFFGPGVAVANHAESGETYRDSIGRRRLDKIISVMRPGDWLFMQFGHNDQKQIKAGNGGPFTTYKDEMKAHIAAVRKAGGHPVVVSPMERRNFGTDGRFVASLSEYARASREAASEEGVPFIDLNSMSVRFYEALGPERSALAFAAPGGKQDNTHHDNYGSYELAKCIVQGIRAAHLDVARDIVADFAGFEPSRPDSLEEFDVPHSPNFTNTRPLGD